MRVLLGLVALAVGVSAQTTLTISSSVQNQYGAFSLPAATGSASLAAIRVRQTSNTGATLTTSPAFIAQFPNVIPSGAWVVTVPNAINTIVFEFATNVYTGQIAYRWSPNYAVPSGAGLNAASYLCDPCVLSAGQFVGDASKCSSSGPGGNIPGTQTPTPTTGFQCASLTRFYALNNLAVGLTTYNSFQVQLWDVNTNPAPNTYSYSFTVVRQAPAVIVGDPQIVGMQGQDFQVHGIPDEVFNMVTYPTLQVNARFTYLESADCHDNYTACFAHPGTYITEEGFRVGKDKVRVSAGSFKKGLTVAVNGKKVSHNVDLKQGAVEVVNHRRVVVHTNIMKITVTNSDKFLNQELELNDDKLISLGVKRRHLKDNERFHAEVPLHGLQGQTWRNVEYPSGLDYEGSITDYHVVDGNLFGTDFVFNHFEA